MMRSEDLITDTYKEHNEDIYGKSSHAYWILDGALSLNKSKYTNGYSDVTWMVTWWQSYLSKNIDQLDKTISSILEEGIKDLNQDFSMFADINHLSKLDRASAGIAIVRINKKTIECFVLGDVEINLKSKSKIITLIDNKIEALDDKVMEMIFNNPNRGQEIAFNDYTKEELEVLKNHRSMMNSEDGYYILEHDINAISNGIYKEYPFDEFKEILMMSDGFSSIYNKYQECSLEELFTMSKTEGVKSSLKLIRDLEENDPKMTTYKRLRRHDDATAIYITL